MQALPRLVAVLLTTAILRPAMGQERSSPPVVDRSVARSQLSSAALNDQPSSVIFKDRRLSVNAENRYLESVANEITQKAGVAIILTADVGRELISVKFQNLPPDEALRQIFQEDDAFFFYGVEKQGPSSLKVVWVYPKGRGRGIEPVPPEKWASTKEVERMLRDTDPQVRVRAIVALIDREGAQARDAVLATLKDPDDSVRAEALNKAIHKGVALSAGFLTNLVLEDPSPDVRLLALDALATSPDVRWLAERAQNDPSAPVREKAREIIAALDSATRQSETPETHPNP